jgi:hypothetical protein
MIPIVQVHQLVNIAFDFSKEIPFGHLLYKI